MRHSRSHLPLESTLVAETHIVGRRGSIVDAWPAFLLGSFFERTSMFEDIQLLFFQLDEIEGEFVRQVFNGSLNIGYLIRISHFIVHSMLLMY